MTIDILRAGLRVEEVEIELRHRATGRDLAGQLHRAKQLRDVTRALVARGAVNADTARDAAKQPGWRRPGWSAAAPMKPDSRPDDRGPWTADDRDQAPVRATRPSRPRRSYRPTVWHRDHRCGLFGIVAATALTLLAGFLGPSAVTITLGPRDSFLPPWYLPAGVVQPNEWLVSSLIWAAIIVGAVGLWVAMRALADGWKPKVRRMFGLGVVAHPADHHRAPDDLGRRADVRRVRPAAGHRA